ncbi:MAG TPA: hypothetical protein VH062_01060 [Polyangiaceae bacterium]|jgi:hypothetical protein|nr:hypothetical protein [Polyangiaceae bacterium]
MVQIAHLPVTARRLAVALSLLAVTNAAQASPAEQDTATDAAQASPAEQDTATRAPSEKHRNDDPHALRLSLRAGAELGFRHFEDRELDGTPRTYSALPIPGIFLGAELVPQGDGLFAFEAALSQSLGVHSTTDDALVGDPPTSTRREVSTSYTRLDVAAKARFFFAESAYVAPLLGFSYSRYAFDGAPQNTENPSGTYDVVRAGVEARAAFGKAAVFGSAEYDELVAIGYLGQARPASTGPGTTLRAGATIALVGMLSARLEASYTFWAYDMVRGVPALATDQYGACRIGVEATF